jgi:hypothetical protein
MSLTATGVTDTRRIPGAIRLDDTVNGTVLYFATAKAGTLDAASLWQIQRITFTTPGQDDLVIEWADGNIKFDNIWDDRLGLSYS